uniref:Nuclear nucleic acid-binding protein C1D n=1 Tax=Nannospalax galili TaxID=1026970 RepID=A0A8C6RV12_NANGA
MAGKAINHGYPVEIHESLSALQSSLGAVDDMLKTMMSVPRNELLQKLDSLEQAKMDLVSDHPIKQELERISIFMNRVKEIADKKKAAQLDRGAASRFVKSALWDPKLKNASKN